MAVTTITSTTTPVATGTTTKNSGVSSSTTVAKSTVSTSSTTATTTASTTERSYVSSATASTTASTTYRVNSSTTSKVTYSSGTTGSSTTPVSSTTPANNNSTCAENKANIKWEGSLIDGLRKENFDSMIGNLNAIIDEGVNCGTKYGLGSVSYNIGLGSTRITYSSSVKFSENNTNAKISVGLGVKKGFEELENIVKNKGLGANAVTVALFDGAKISVREDGSVHGICNVGNAMLDYNYTAVTEGVLDITISTSHNLDDKTIITNSINFSSKINPYGDANVEKVSQNEITVANRLKVFDKSETNKIYVPWYESIIYEAEETSRELGDGVQSIWKDIMSFISEHEEDMQKMSKEIEKQYSKLENTVEENRNVISAVAVCAVVTLAIATYNPAFFTML